MNELTENKNNKNKFSEKFKEYINKDIENIREKPVQAIKDFITGLIIYLTIGIIILFFITRPIHCYTNNNKIIQIEEYKFNYKNVAKCEMTYKQEITNTYKAITTKIYYEQETQKEDNAWSNQINLTINQ